jgi:parallel beta-helix repeat protein
VFAPIKGFLVVSAGPPASGDWIVIGVEVYSNHEVFVLNGNLVVESGGNLTLKGVTLEMNCAYDGQYNITVETGGAFYVLEGSAITSVNAANEYCFFVQDESTFKMSGSELHECGMSSPSDWKKSGLCIQSNDTVIENSLISDNNCGIFIDGREPVIRNNNITNNEQGIMLGNGSPTIYNNTITSNLERGIGTGGNASLPLIINNSISKNWVGIDSWFGSSPIILNNTITSNINDGIFINHHGNPTISGNVITLNSGSGIGCSNYSNAVIQNNIVTANGLGIMCGDHSDATIQSNNISQNNRGISCHFSSPNICSNNIISNYQGIWLNNSNPSIQDNTIAFNNGEGIVGTFCNPTIRGNIITSNSGYAGIVLKGNINAVIQGNTIVNNTDGIQIAHNCSVTIQGNIITSNWGIGILCNDTARLEVHKNDIYSNAGYGVKNDDLLVTVNATSNYWGSASGPARTMPDSIDPEEISGNVLYNPWLTESIFSAKITGPATSGLVSATIPVWTEVHAENGVEKVEYFVDDKLEYTDYDTPYEWTWDTTKYTETEHRIVAKAYDLLGLKILASLLVFIDNTSPAISIKEPESGKIYYGIIDVCANATDNKELGGVRFRVDNNEWLAMIYNSTDLLWKYDLNTTTLPDGQHTLMVLALDKAGNPSTTSVTLRFDNTPPTLSIQTPQSGMTVGLTLVVSVQASDASNVSRIEFYLQDALVCTALNVPYQWSWDTTEYPNGEYTIKVKAYDAVGHAQTSQTTITVKNVESPWWETNIWTIIQVLVAIGSLMLAVVAFLAGKRKVKKREKKNNGIISR